MGGFPIFIFTLLLQNPPILSFRPKGEITQVILQRLTIYIVEFRV